MTIPKWVQEITIEVAIDHDRNDLPEVVWRRRRKNEWGWKDNYSSGVAYENKIAITAGKSRVDQKLVLLHELSHWLMPEDEHHSAGFWDKVWELYRKYKVPIKYAIDRETDDYSGYKGALLGYKRSRGKLRRKI